MTRVLACLLLILPALTLLSQPSGAPAGFNYQAIARDFNGEELRNVDILVRISIYSGETGVLEWQEMHSVTTNKFGLFTLVIGKGTHEGGRRNYFTEMQWGLAPHFLQVHLSFDGGTNFVATEKTQLFSVPYALYANSAANAGGGGSDGDTSPANEIQSLAQTDTLLLLKNSDGSTQSSLRNDFDPKNEIQDLLLNSHILKITNNPDANSIDLEPYMDDKDEQLLSNKGDSIHISGGNTINLKRFYDNTDEQTLSLEADSLRISGGNAVSIAELRNPESVTFYSDKSNESDINPLTDKVLIFNDVKENNGNAYSSTNGNFTAIINGIYSFYFIYEAPFSTQSIKIYVNNDVQDVLLETTESGKKYRFNFVLYLSENEIVNMVVNSGTGNKIGKATWAGFKVY